MPAAMIPRERELFEKPMIHGWTWCTTGLGVGTDLHLARRFHATDGKDVLLNLLLNVVIFCHGCQNPTIYAFSPGRKQRPWFARSLAHRHSHKQCHMDVWSSVRTPTKYAWGLPLLSKGTSSDKPIRGRWRNTSNEVSSRLKGSCVQ